MPLVVSIFLALKLFSLAPHSAYYPRTNTMLMYSEGQIATAYPIN